MFTTSHFHPMLVHFPIALVIFGFLAVIASLFFKKTTSLPKIGFFLLVTGTLTGGAALISGIFFTNDLSGSAGSVQNTHETFAWITLGLLVVTTIYWSFLRLNNRSDIGVNLITTVLYGLATVSVSITGFLGGTLVYDYMMPI
jgi:uncharacterized membrane protein